MNRIFFLHLRVLPLGLALAVLPATAAEVGVDFGTDTSPVAAGYTGFVAAENATQVINGVTITTKSSTSAIEAKDDAEGDDLFSDSAFLASRTGYLSVRISGLNNGTLNLTSSHAAAGAPGVVRVAFGVVGTTLHSIGTVNCPGTATYTTPVEADTNYELRILFSSASRINAAFISGLLLSGDAVPGGGSGAYDTYVTTAGLDPATTGAPDLDPDLDGVETGLEWVLGGSADDRAAPDTGKLPVGAHVTADPDGDTNDSDYLRFTYRRSDQAAADPNTAITVEYGSDPATWIPATDGINGVVIVETDDGAGPGIDRVEVYLPASLAGDGKLLARLKVTIGA